MGLADKVCVKLLECCGRLAPSRGTKVTNIFIKGTNEEGATAKWTKEEREGSEC